MGYSDVRAFLLHLATKEGVAASTQNQALNALLYDSEMTANKED